MSGPTPARQTGAIIAIGAIIAGLVGVALDSVYWLIAGGLAAWAFWAGTAPPGD